MIFRSAVEHEEAGPEANGAGRGDGILGRQAQERGDHDPDRGLVVLADDQQVISPLAPKQGRRRVFDRDRIADPRRWSNEATPATPSRASRWCKSGVPRQVGRCVPLEDDRRARQHRLALDRHLVKLLQISLAPFVGQPDHLEEMVALGGSVGVVVDRLARA